MRIPPEVRLKIYEHVLTVPNKYMNHPLIVVNDSGNTHSMRGQYRILSMCPSWVGNDGTARKLFSVSRQIHHEAENHLYSRYTLFFLNSFHLDRLGEFIGTMSDTSRHLIRCIGFEVLFFVHSRDGAPKRTLKQYEHAGWLLAERLPQWTTVIFYLDPETYYPSSIVGGEKLAVRGMKELAAMFTHMQKSVKFFPFQSNHRHLAEKA